MENHILDEIKIYKLCQMKFNYWTGVKFLNLIYF